MHIFTKHSIHTIMSCKLINSYIKINSLGLMIKHEQFYLNYSTKHINSQKLFLRTLLSGIVKPSFTIPDKSQIIGSPCEPGFHGHFRPISNQYMINTKNTQFHTNISRGEATGCSILFQNFILIRSQGLGPIKRPITASIDLNIRKTLKV